jgi:hypothetical protein
MASIARTGTRVLAVAVGSALLLAGCGVSANDAGTGQTSPEGSTAATPGDASPSQTPTPDSAAAPIQYASATELVEAFLAAGATCDNWKQTDDVDPAYETVRCDNGEGDVLMMFATARAAQLQAQYIIDTSDAMEMDGMVLLGSNWVINSDQAALVAEAMGGTVMTSGSGTEGADGQTGLTLTEAAEYCDVVGNKYFEIGDSGRSLIIDGAPDDKKRGAAFEDIGCVLGYTGVTDAAIERITSTRALDGRQDTTWGTISASWTYHPDNGLDMLLEDTG